MSFAHIGEIKEVSNVIEANELIEAGAELLAIVPGWTADNTPCTLFYLGHAKVKSNARMKLSDEALAKAAEKKR